jgi:hypothetical protein
MEPLEKQVQSLSNKLDALYQVIERLDEKVSQTLLSSTLDRTQLKESHLSRETGTYQLKGHINFSSELEHKDVLVDGVYTDGGIQGGDKNLTTEIQIQRLTAQLTAAYNRIAALEEQLLLKRIHP